jgi:23S rRNA pseudouridine1911/1915/1917 synthase
VPAGVTVSVGWNARGTSWNRAKARDVLEESGLRILHQDAHIVAIDKPPGMLTDTATRKQARERDSVRKRVHAWLTNQGQAAYIVHRIDRDTSGVVLVARDAATADDLRNQFRERAPLRRYRALVWGVPEPGHWVDWMSWDRRHRRQTPRKESASGASRASAEARVLEAWGTGASEIEVTLESGRRNQIRLQAQLRGCPLVGETQYIDEDHRPRWRIEAPRQMLHAEVLEVRHPVTGKRLRVEAPLPRDYTRVQASLRSRAPTDD